MHTQTLKHTQIYSSHLIPPTLRVVKFAHQKKFNGQAKRGLKTNKERNNEAMHGIHAIYTDKDMPSQHAILCIRGFI